MTSRHTRTERSVRLHSAAGRWIVAASVLGSGAAFLEGSMVNVALPAIAREFGLAMAGLQWVLNGYLLTLSALMLLGGALGDRFPRSRVFGFGSLAFAGASVGCALAPDLAVLVALRLIQGVAGALLVPNSLAMLETAFPRHERGEAIGQWAAWSAFSTSVGPLLGGWLVDTVSWRWVFAAIVPFSVAAAWIVRRHRPPQRPTAGAVDYWGAALATLGLAGTVWALISGPDLGFGYPAVLATGLGGIALLAGFVVVERRVERAGRQPLLPLGVFRSRQFTGANLTTLLIYIALNGLFFLLMPQLQLTVGYRALVAGAALLPVNVLMLVLSPVAGRVATRIGPRLPMAIGALVAGGAMLLFARIGPGASYLGHVLPAAVVFGVGLAALVAPLTRAVMAVAGEQDAGMASGINNAIARLAGLRAAAALPLAAGLGGLGELAGPAFRAGYVRAMMICAGLCLAGAVVTLLTVSGRGRGAAS
jgi:EmrB/QacA subfamily drug resistance transporter